MTKHDRIINALARDIAEKADKLRAITTDRDSIFAEYQDYSDTCRAEIGRLKTRELQLINAVTLTLNDLPPSKRNEILEAMEVR